MTVMANVGSESQKDLMPFSDVWVEKSEWGYEEI